MEDVSHIYIPLFCKCFGRNTIKLLQIITNYYNKILKNYCNLNYHYKTSTHKVAL